MCIYTLYAFFQVSMALSEFHGSVKEIIRRACEDALMREGFVPDPIEDISQPEGGEKKYMYMYNG